MYKQTVGESALTGIKKTIGGGAVPVPRKNLYKLLLIHFIPECKNYLSHAHHFSPYKDIWTNQQLMYGQTTSLENITLAR